jgi:predicted enzyme related to lactoylglutathione lyase
MSDRTSELPARPSLERLRKQAKERLSTLRADDEFAKLADAQFIVAREYGFDSWPKLVQHVSAVDPVASEPRITAPVSRYLGAVDIGRAVGFWKDVLGFHVRGAADDGSTVDLTSGRARIRFGTRDSSPGFAGEGRRPGSAIVFFETDDVRAMHAAIRRRGGEPSDLEKVNWIKMRMFQIRDPDEHTIWFGQSYHSESPARPRLMMRTVMPELPFDAVPAGVKHYRDVLGFSVNYEQHDIGVLDRDEVRVLLVARTPHHSGIGSAYFYVRDADALYAELLEKGADVQGETISQPWGLREFTVLDVERNRLTFGQTFE